MGLHFVIYWLSSALNLFVSKLKRIKMIGKIIKDGYPLKSEYFLSPLGKKMFDAISIMQDIGLELLNDSDLL